MNHSPTRRFRQAVTLMTALALLIALPAFAGQATPSPTWPPSALAEPPEAEPTEEQAALIARARALLVTDLEIDDAYLPQGVLTVEMMTLWGPEREVALAVFDDQPGGVLYAVYLDPLEGTPLRAEAFRMEGGVCLTEVMFEQEEEGQLGVIG